MARKNNFKNKKIGLNKASFKTSPNPSLERRGEKKSANPTLTLPLVRGGKKKPPWKGGENNPPPLILPFVRGEKKKRKKRRNLPPLYLDTTYLNWLWRNVLWAGCKTISTPNLLFSAQTSSSWRETIFAVVLLRLKSFRWLSLSGLKISKFCYEIVLQPSLTPPS